MSHCFNLNGNPDPTIVGLQNVFNTYKVNINQIGLAGPTYFSHILEALLAFMKQSMELQMYHILLILTDGAIHDMRKVIDLVVEAANYPLSIIIVGIGSADFSNME